MRATGARFGVVGSLMLALASTAGAAGPNFARVARFDSVAPVRAATPIEDEIRASRSAFVSATRRGIVGLEAEFRGTRAGYAAALAVWNVPFRVRSGTILCTVFALGPRHHQQFSVFGNAFSSPLFSVSHRPLRLPDLSPPDDVPAGFDSGAEETGHIDRRCSRSSVSGRFYLRAGAAIMAGVRGDLVAAGWGRADASYEILRAEVWICRSATLEDCSNSFQSF